MKLENRGYRVNQRIDEGTICSSFEWKITLQLSQGYHAGILTFLSIVIVIIRKAGTFKIKNTISRLEFRRSKDYLPSVNQLISLGKLRLAFVIKTFHYPPEFNTASSNPNASKGAISDLEYLANQSGSGFYNIFYDTV